MEGGAGDWSYVDSSVIHVWGGVWSDISVSLPGD